MNDILITGGSGFFGKAFIQHCLTENLSDRICIYSRDEWKHAQLRSYFQDDQRLRWFIGDVRDKDRLERAMNGIETVIHAAALKRVETGEYNVDELVKTNVLGAINIIESAEIASVSNVVALSTDKAASPINAYGASKLLSEKLFLSANNTRGYDGPHFAVTRYGNVAGSTGSVIPIWRALIAEGAKAVPVTDPDCTRFWMTAAESVYLVISAIGKEKLIIPELPAYRLGDLAEAMNVSMVITGLDSHEKRHEMMSPGNHSDTARRMSVEEIREKLCDV